MMPASRSISRRPRDSALRPFSSTMPRTMRTAARIRRRTASSAVFPTRRRRGTPDPLQLAGPHLVPALRAALELKSAPADHLPLLLLAAFPQAAPLRRFFAGKHGVLALVDGARVEPRRDRAAVVLRGRHGEEEDNGLPSRHLTTSDQAGPRRVRRPATLHAKTASEASAHVQANTSQKRV